MPEKQICAGCGAELVSDAPAGVCVPCALRGVLEPPSEPGAAAEPNQMSLSHPLADAPAGRIGPYKLLEQLGEGGCGIVYLAEQEAPVRRRVALKVIKPGMDSRQVLARFESERQALALMDHPNIAKVLDAGSTATGRPYFVMELVRGIPITEYCDRAKRSTRERLDLFVQVCQAIQHAHQKGVIHRDIKPSNILVTLLDGIAVPKVIDFGIAKATTGQPLTDKTIFTALEQFVGTPAYMSPEQAELTGLDIDTRSDIYALGVLLYELLTGHTPFEAKDLLAKGIDEIRRVIREDDPPRPSTKLSTLDASEQTLIANRRQAEPPRLLGIIRGDLDWIVMKCLEKERARRYETANGLAMDINRHLNNEPVLAAAPTALYKFGKFSRRNKVALIVCSIVLLSVVVAALAACSAFRSQHASLEARMEMDRVREVARIETNRLMQAQLYELAQLILKGDTFASAEARQRQVAAMVQALAGDPSKSKINAPNSSGFNIMPHPEKQHAEVEQFFGNLVTAMPTNETAANRAQIFRSRGAFRAQHGKWAEAAEDLSEAVGIEPDDHWNWFLLAPVLVQTGDAARYRSHCAAMLARFGRTKDPTLAERTAKVCLLLPLGREFQMKAIELAENAISAGPIHGYFAFFQFVIGLADYRTGEFEGATDRARAVLGVRDQPPYLRAQAMAVLAMASERLQKRDEAREYFVAAIELSASSLPLMTGSDLGSSWHDVLIADLLMREAKMLIGTNDFSTEQTTRFLRASAFLKARHGQWKQAIVDLQRAIESAPTNHLLYHDLAPLFVITHDIESYRKHSQQESLQFCQTTDPVTAHRMAKDCLILEGSGVDTSVVEAWADRSLIAGSGDWAWPAFQFTKALAQYRIGLFGDTARRAKEAISSLKNWSDVEVEANALLAMAEYRLGQALEAQQALTQAKQIVATRLPRLESGDLGAGWVDWIIARQLVEEATLLIETRH